LINDPRVTLVEDAAQAMGEIRDGRKVGTFGDVSFFSLGRGKALSVVEGGIILTNRDDLAEKLNSHMQRIPRYGPLSLLNLIVKAAALMVLIHPWMFWLPRGIPLLKLGETLFEPNFPIRRMSSFQAGLAGNWRRKLDRMRDVRQKNVTRWVAFLDASRIGASHFLDSQALALPRFPLRIGDSARRTFLLDEFTGRRLGIMPVYPTSIDAIPELKGNVAGSFPVAERCARELVTLPTHAYLTEHDIARLRRLLTSISGEKKRL
jgi:dTDP-4-amino-4,6-dideoxygalactose transaminase